MGVCLSDQKGEEVATENMPPVFARPLTYLLAFVTIFPAHLLKLFCSLICFAASAQHAE